MVPPEEAPPRRRGRRRTHSPLGLPTDGRLLRGVALLGLLRRVALLLAIALLLAVTLLRGVARLLLGCIAVGVARLLLGVRGRLELAIALRAVAAARSGDRVLVLVGEGARHATNQEAG